MERKPLICERYVDNTSICANVTDPGTRYGDLASRLPLRRMQVNGNEKKRFYMIFILQQIEHWM